jgi:hypothetical protein
MRRRDEAIVHPFALASHRDNASLPQRIRSDDARIDVVTTWKTAEPSVALSIFLDLIQKNTASIRKKAELV